MCEKVCFITKPRLIEEYTYIKELGRGGQARVDLVKETNPNIDEEEKKEGRGPIQNIPVHNNNGSDSLFAVKTYTFDKTSNF